MCVDLCVVVERKRDWAVFFCMWTVGANLDSKAFVVAREKGPHRDWHGPDYYHNNCSPATSGAIDGRHRRR